MLNKQLINPSYVYKYKMPSTITDEALNYVEQLKFKKGFFRPNSASEDFTLHTKDPIKKGADIILNQMEQIIKENGFEASNLHITNSQVNCTKQGEFHSPHDHANCMLTCVWYLNDADCNTLFYRLNEWVDQKLYVYPMRPRGGSSGASFNFKLLDWYDEEGQHIQENFEPFMVHKEPTIKNNVLIFPSSMLHMVTKNKSTHNRYTFSMNVFPKKFGQKTNQVDLT
tara:strand:- start:1133 stop:1810 length:678 start_codon:yes stop_codon:yes gene_type:complete